MKRKHVIVPAVVAAAALILTGCSSSSGPSKDARGEACIASGSVSDSIKVKTGEDTPSLETKTPITVDKAERTVLKQGKGDVVAADGSINISFLVYNGLDGTAINGASETLVQNTPNLYTGTEWVEDLIRCAVPGQQAALAMPASDFFGEDLTAAGAPEGVKKNTAIVVVADFTEAKDAEADNRGSSDSLSPDELLKKAEGTAKEAPAGFPKVELAENGEPTITMPEGAAAPTELKIATIIEGEGDVVNPGDTVYVNYKGVIWSTGKEFDSSWSRGEPTPFPTTGVIPGFQKALEGQKVGSQIISIVPPAEGYGADGLQQMGQEPDAVMVFVLDIVGVLPAK
ncbi:FKBP-type peptidyl-prolyl cis-trans isomerase [Leucobacter sp. 1207-22]|uniref:FKBP-type peptidyl-prolyl cis-trans isomerase n=1 Tax=Leucobacter sp. 1207-22 TaxID=2604456 RepID=UPI00406327A5